MALKWIESFDTDVTDFSSIYENVSGTFTTTTGRLQGLGILSRSTTWPIFRTKNMGNHGTWIVGIAIRPENQAAEQKLFTILNDTNEQISVWLAPGSISTKIKFRVKRGSTTLGTTANEFTNGFWGYLEVKVVLDTTGSDGSVTLRYNEASELALSGIDTTNHASSVANKVEFNVQHGTSQFAVDDIYICDGSGAKNNDLLGDQAAEGKLPNADGNRVQWTRNSGSSGHFTYVDDATLDNDTTFLFVPNTSNGLVELWGFPDISQITGDVKGVMLRWAARMDSSGTDNMRPIFRNGGGSEATGTQVSVTSIAGYEWFQQIYEDDPVAAAAWTVSSFNAMEMGLESRP